MHTPYITAYPEAVAIAQISVAAVMTAVVWRAPPRPSVAVLPLLAAIWLTAMAPFEATFLTAVGVTLDPEHGALVLTVVRALTVLAFAIARPRWFLVVVLLGAIALWKIGTFLQESTLEIIVLHSIFIALSYAVHARVTAPRVPASTVSVTPRRHVAHDVVLFAAATLLASLVCVYVIERFCNSGDEWAYTYQADLFAHFKAYGQIPPCPGLFQNYWVFFHLGKAFAQYMPGWPLVIAPFQRVGLAWLATPFVFGLLCVGVARLARRAVMADPRADAKQIAWAGTIAGICTLIPAGMLLNAGSRFPHIAVATWLVWTIECACATATPVSKRAQWAWGAGLGFSAAMLMTTRHGDACMLGIGIAIVYVYWLARRRVGWRSLAGAAIVSAVIGALALVILRMQLGEWFKTGHSIAGDYFPFGKVSFSMPKPTEFKYGVPVATGSYMWWPCAPAIGGAGLLLARGRATAISVMLIVGALANTAMYTALEFGRGYDSGYGPRYHLPTVVAMAVGTAILLAPLARDAARRTGASLRNAGPAVLAALAVASGTLRIATLVYPEAHAEVHQRDGTFRAIAAAKLKNAVVTVAGADVAFDPLDLTQNLPTVAEPDVLILLRSWGPEAECGRKRFRERRWYRAVGTGEEVKLEPQ